MGLDHWIEAELFVVFALEPSSISSFRDLGEVVVVAAEVVVIELVVVFWPTHYCGLFELELNPLQPEYL